MHEEKQIYLNLLYKLLKQYHRDHVRKTVNVSGKENYIKTYKKISHVAGFTIPIFMS